MKEIRRLLELTRPYRASYAAALAALIAGSAALLLIPPQMGRLMASLSGLATGGSDRAARQSILAAAVLLAVHGLASLAYSFLVSCAAERIINNLRGRFFWNLVNQPLGARPPKALGEIASEFGSDLSLVQDGLSTTLTDCIRHGLVTIGAFTALFLIDFKMTLIAIAGVGAVAGVILVFIRKATSSLMLIQQCRAKVMALLLESASNVYVIQAYGRSKYMNRRFGLRLREMYSQVRRQMLLVACMNPVCLVLFAAVMGALAIYAMQQLRSTHLTIPMLISYFTFAAVVVASVSQVGYLGGRLRQAGAILARHDRLLARGVSTPTANSNVHASMAGPFGFEADDVIFTYPGKEPPAIAGISFVIPPGKVTAIVGESGSGKSTVAALLCGLYQPDSGSIRLLDKYGEPAEIAPELLRRKVAIVPQEPFLFSGTVLENITFGREEISEGAARSAASAARIHDFVMSLPHGYDTTIDESGRDLSRGQKQRIAIARALAGRPEVVIMDEATASLDIASERAIKSVIGECRGSTTFVVIAHQGALLADVDHCIVLHNGRIVSEGVTAERQVAAGGMLC